MAGKHGWNDLENYLHIALRALDSHPFVIAHTIQIEPSPEGGQISGEVFCHENVVLRVSKYYQVRLLRGRKQARTVNYSYHARRGDQDILRYDNVHRRRRHASPHHKHEFLPSGERVLHVGEEWPHLSEVLDELQDMIWGTA